MKKVGVFSTLILLFLSNLTSAQQPVATPALPDTSRMTFNQISQQMNLFVYPTNGQNNQQQKVDEFQCYLWAVEQSGVDPLNLPKVEVTQQSGPTGGAVRGAARGAAAGAAIGAVAGDAGRGAAIGATAGAISGRRQGQHAQAQSNQQARDQAAAQEQETMNRFRTAFTVCMTGRGYTIK